MVCCLNLLVILRSWLSGSLQRKCNFKPCASGSFNCCFNGICYIFGGTYDKLYYNHIRLYLSILDKAEVCLKESEKLLVECTEGDHKDNSTSLACLRDMKTTSKDISQQLSG